MNNSKVRIRGLSLLEGTLILLVIGIFAALLFPVYASRKGGGRSICMSNVKQLGLGCLMYSGDYDVHMPSSRLWMDKLQPYLHNESMYHDFEGIPDGSYGYALRKSLAGSSTLLLRDITKFVMVFDSNLTGRNESGSLDLLPKPGRHKGQDSVEFADGHAKSVVTDNHLFDLVRDDKTAGPR